MTNHAVGHYKVLTRLVLMAWTWNDKSCHYKILTRLVSSSLSMAQEPPVWTRLFLDSKSLRSTMARLTHLCPRGAGNLFSSEFAHSWRTCQAKVMSCEIHVCHVMPFSCLSCCDIFVFAMWCHIHVCHVMSYSSCLSCHVIYMLVMLWHIHVCYVMSYSCLSCHVIFMFVMSCHIHVCHVVTYSCLPCHVIFMFAMSCHIHVSHVMAFSCLSCCDIFMFAMSCHIHVCHVMSYSRQTQGPKKQSGYEDLCHVAFKASGVWHRRHKHGFHIHVQLRGLCLAPGFSQRPCSCCGIRISCHDRIESLKVKGQIEIWAWQQNSLILTCKPSDICHWVCTAVLGFRCTSRGGEPWQPFLT